MPFPFRNPNYNTEDGDPPEQQLPDYFTPSSDASSSQWSAPDYFTPAKTEDKPSVMSKVKEVAKAFGGDLKEAWDKSSEPLTEAPTRFAESASKYINPNSETKGMRGVGSAYIEGLGHAISGLSSPLNLALAAMSGGSSLAEKAGAEQLALGLNYGERALSAPIATEGGKHIYEGVKDKDWAKILSGGLEAGMGGLGMRERSIYAKEELPIKQPRGSTLADKLINTTPQQDAVAIALTKDNVPRTSANISAETGIPKSSIRRTISEIKKKTANTVEPSAEVTPPSRDVVAKNLQDFIKQNPTAPMSEVENFIKNVSSQTPVDIPKPSVEQPFIRQPRVIQPQSDIPADLVPVGGEDIFNKNRPNVNINKDAQEAIYENAKNKFKMGQSLPDYFKPAEAPIEPNKPFVNPFEKPSISQEAPKEDLYSLATKETGPVKEGLPYTDENGKTIGYTTDNAGSTGMKLVEDKWSAPDYFKPSEEPQAARTESGKLAIGADVKSLGKVLGTSLYKGDIAPIATKELLQNSIDAVRHLGEEGKIDVILDHNDHSIHVSDNGKGLTKQELESVFTNLGASGKREDVNAAGGFGLAKAAPLLGGKSVEVSSVTRGADGILHEYSFNGTPNELLEGVDIKHRIMPKGTSTGTKVKVNVPEDSSFYQARKFVENLSQHSPNIQSKIRMGENYFTGKYDPESILNLQTIGKGKSIAKLDSPSAVTELIEPSNAERGTRSSVDLHLSNNGMYQGTRTMHFVGEVPNIPKSITVDIHSKVPEGHTDYPFTANREELRGTTEKQIMNYIDENIVKPGIGKRVDELKRLYNSMQEITVGKGEFPGTFGHKIAIYDPKGQITSGEMKEITSNSAFQTLVSNIAGTLKEAMKVAGTPEWSDRLEKIGIIFEDKLHGIHIPNPGSGKSAILINPFIAIDKMSPDEASANILHTILHEMAHVAPDRPGHNESFTIRLGDIYGKFGARRSIEAQDSILRSIADPNTGLYNPEIQKVLSAYKESRGREATTEDLLSRTGISSRLKGGGEGDISKSDKSNGEGVVRSALDKLFNSMGKTLEQRTQQDIINKTERARRFAAFAGVKQEGMAGAKKSLSALKGEFEKVDPEKLLLKPQEADTLFTAVKRAKITEGEKARGYTALFKILNGEELPQRNELRILDDVFGNGFASRIIEMHAGFGGVSIKLAKVANTMKSLENSISLAAPLRHGIGLITRKEFYPAFADMFRFFGNKEYYDSAMSAIENRPNYIFSRECGLFTSKPGSLFDSEEGFLNSYVGKIPIIKYMVAASQRAYVGFLNKLRADTFDSMIEQAKGLGYAPSTLVGDQLVPTKEAKAIANFINNATGRGSLGSLNKMTNELNMILWSPRMIASRLNMLTNPKLYMDLPKGMRLDGLKSLFGIAALGTIIDTLAAYGGAKISTNILSTDFGKSRFGSHLIDPWGGFQQYIVAAARFLAGKTDSTQPTNRLEIAGRALANKESPAASLAHTLLTSKYTGNSMNPSTQGNLTTQYGEKSSVQSQISKQFIPIFIQDLHDLMSTEPKWSDNIGLTSIMGAASLAGMAQNYPEKKRLQFRKMKLR
jgi:hypothetical protein